MDMTVTGIASVVVAELRAAGYMESTIGQYEKTIKALRCFVESRGGSYTPALGAAFAALTISPRTGRFSAQRRFDYRRLVGVFDSYVATGRVDLSCRKRGGGGPRPVSREFTVLAAAWDADMGDRGLAPATRDAYGRVACGYLVFLESRGIDCLAAPVRQPDAGPQRPRAPGEAGQVQRAPRELHDLQHHGRPHQPGQRADRRRTSSAPR